MAWSRFIISVALVVTFFPCITLANERLTRAKEIVHKAKQECNDIENGKFHSTVRAITLHDITGDGQPEEFVDASQFSCSTAMTLWGGSGGTYLWIIVDDKEYEFLAHQWRVIDIDGQSVILLAVHSYECGDDIGPCYRALAWQDGFRTTRSGHD